MHYGARVRSVVHNPSCFFFVFQYSYKQLHRSRLVQAPPLAPLPTAPPHAYLTCITRSPAPVRILCSIFPADVLLFSNLSAPRVFIRGIIYLLRTFVVRLLFSGSTYMLPSLLHVFFSFHIGIPSTSCLWLFLSRWWRLFVHLEVAIIWLLVHLQV